MYVKSLPRVDAIAQKLRCRFNAAEPEIYEMGSIIFQFQHFDVFTQPVDLEEINPGIHELWNGSAGMGINHPMLWKGVHGWKFYEGFTFKSS